jgi:Fe-S-cluster containining protein
MDWTKMRKELFTKSPYPWKFTFQKLPAGTIPHEPEIEGDGEIEANPVLKMLTKGELDSKRSHHAQLSVETCMVDGCSASTKKFTGNQHHCRSCGKCCCTSCSGTRKRLIFKQDDGVKKGQVPCTIGRKFKEKRKASDWSSPSWQKALPVAEAIRELAEIDRSEEDKGREYMLRVMEQKDCERVFPNANLAMQWLEEVLLGKEPDHSWERVCNECRDQLRGEIGMDV